jgi:REP-associated tyrosine transposase
MPRQGRLHVPHATYFVVNRFQAGLDALAASPDRRHAPEELRRIDASRHRFETLLGYLSRRWCARVNAYCWMPQSALLIVRIGAAPLERIMHTLRGLYSQFLREKGRLSGPLYTGRYTALVIDPQDYLLDVARHLFWSPVHAGLCRTPLGYEHSSVRTCVGEPDPAALCDTTIREALMLRGQHSRLGFARFLTEAPTPGFLRLLAHGSRLDRRVVGSSAFVSEAQRIAARRAFAMSRGAIVTWAAARLGIDPSDIRARSRRAHSVEGRALVAWLATCADAATLGEVARWFRCDPSTLHRAVDRYCAAHPVLFNERVVDEFIAAAMPRAVARARPATD